LIPPSDRIDPWRVRVKPTKPGQHEGLVFCTGTLFKQIAEDETLQQVANVAMLPGLIGPSLAMPDAHQGYGFPIGGVCATDPEHGGVVSPGGVGFDINCGVRLLATDLSAKEAGPHVKDLLDDLFQRVPVGFAKATGRAVKGKEMDRVLAEGAQWAVGHGFGVEDDVEKCEENGRLGMADPSRVSERAKERGEDQIGTLGSGNHFLEIQRVDQVLIPELAEAFGLAAEQIVVLVHTGSRGLGHQVCTDYVAKFQHLGRGKELDRQLAAAPVDSDEGRAYLGAMASAANYAWANRQVVTWHVRQALAETFGHEVPCRVVYDVSHNMAKLEQHTVEGHEKRVCVHRKGAIRAFPAGHPDIPEAYRAVGQPVFIPGSMGTSSWVLVGTDRALRETWGSVCHGAGRSMSRTAAKKHVRADQVVKDLKERGIEIRSGSKAGIVEEFPGAYKDVSEVVRCVEGAGLARAVAKLVPMGVLKG
jgi:tRNA-splicing ligase RtcB